MSPAPRSRAVCSSSPLETSRPNRASVRVRATAGIGGDDLVLFEPGPAVPHFPGEVAEVTLLADPAQGQQAADLSPASGHQKIRGGV
jgi:hypothetical protein